MGDDNKKSRLLPEDGSKGRASRKGFAADARFINHSFSEEQKERLRAMVDEGFGDWEWLNRILQDGYAVTVKPDERGKGCLCILRPTSDTNPNYGLLLTGRHTSANRAWVAAAYRHFILCEGDWRLLDDGDSGADF